MGQGGTCDVMQLCLQVPNYRLTSTPTPTMEGYKFDGWYDDVVGGTKITTRYNFKDVPSTRTDADGQRTQPQPLQPRQRRQHRQPLTQRRAGS
ncbi:MAG: InlB B-repeat-containing protein [Neglectibacter sp.]